MREHVGWVLIALFVIACGEPDAQRDAGRETDAGARDAGMARDAGRARDAGAVNDAGRVDAGECPAPPAAPTARLEPQAGELFYAQIGLGGFALGEAALIVGPDGTIVLVDAGNDSHDDDVADVIEAITGATDVDHVVVTHFHADHGDGVTDLLDRITLRGNIVHRGFTDLTGAANDATIDALCEVIAARPGSGAPLCEASSAAPCSGRSGTYPATSCAGLTSEDLALGSGAQIDFVAANGFIGADRYETTVGPIRTDDSNGENARSVVGVISHGAFRMLIAGDLTGGGSDTDDLESFYASRLASVPALGVDVLHLGHHGRDTSTNATWAARLLPADGRSRNAVMGISTAHLNSPHDEVLDVVFEGDRLAEGRAWTTTVSAGGATAADLVSADGGHVLIATLDGGAAYAIQAIDERGAVLESRTFRSVAACP
jgi:beta-lactamase superfamily II metal-dependent hydrolase